MFTCLLFLPQTVTAKQLSSEWWSLMFPAQNIPGKNVHSELIIAWPQFFYYEPRKERPVITFFHAGTK